MRDSPRHVTPHTRAVRPALRVAHPTANGAAARPRDRQLTRTLEMHRTQEIHEGDPALGPATTNPRRHTPTRSRAHSLPNGPGPTVARGPARALKPRSRGTRTPRESRRASSHARGRWFEPSRAHQLKALLVGGLR